MGFAGKALQPGNALMGFTGLPKDINGYLLAGPAYQTYKNQKKANAEQQKAQDAALEAAKKTQKDAEEAQGRANQKRPDYGAALTANTVSGGGTILTGPGGVNPALLQIGKTTLLGGV